MKLRFIFNMLVISLGMTIMPLQGNLSRFVTSARLFGQRMLPRTQSLMTQAPRFSTTSFNASRPTFSIPEAKILCNQAPKINFLNTLPRFSNEERFKWQGKSKYLFAAVPGLAAVLNEDDEKASEDSINTACISLGEVITLPNAQTLAQRLRSKSPLFESFDEITGLSKKLGSQKLYPDALIINIESAIYDFEQYVNKLQDDSESRIFRQYLRFIRMKYNYATLIKLILQDSPEAIEYLKQSEYLINRGVTL